MPDTQSLRELSGRGEAAFNADDLLGPAIGSASGLRTLKELMDGIPVTVEGGWMKAAARTADG
jgi:hypothetical protein